MIRQTLIKDRGPTPRGYARIFGNLQKQSWHEAGVYFHEKLRDKRFTGEHAAKAGYTRRKGEGLPRDSKAFRRSYTGIKLRRFGHTRPLEFSGETRNRVRMASITTTRKGAKVAYQGAAKLNFRHPKSQIRMNEEFRFITAPEVRMIARKFDVDLDQRLARDQTMQTKVVG